MKDKMTVKDLATELNVDTKELAKSIQQLGIDAKASTSTISGEDIERVRNHVKNKGRGNVIVRRRANTPNTQEAAVEQKNDEVVVEQTSVDKEVSEASDSTEKVTTKKTPPKKSSAKANTQAKQVPAARIVTKPVVQEEAVPVSNADDVAAKITKTEEQSPPSEPQVIDAEQSKVVVAEDVVKDTTTQKAPRSTTPDASAAPEGSSVPTIVARNDDEPKENKENANTGEGTPAPKNKKRERGPKKRIVQEEVQQVRVISRPTFNPAEQQRQPRQDNKDNARPARPGARPGTGAGTGAGAGARGPRPSRPGQQQPGRSAGPAGNREGGARFPRQNTTPNVDVNLVTPDAGEGQSKKKRMKGRRTVEFQQSGDFGRFGHDDEHAQRIGRSHKGKRKNKDSRQNQANTTQPLKAAKRKIRVTEAIRVSDMAHQMGLKAHEIIQVLFNLGVMATINQSLDIETATLVAAEFEYEVEKAGFSEDDYLIPTEADKAEDLRPRPPVVTIMGHVDHGKTSLLDSIRKSNVTGGEAGGITQHIGAYHVRTKRGEIVFLDTPGHEAFTAMRARGAQVTDLVILVVAADDGVMEQTREAINHSKAANVPIMVAVNKMDKEGADPDRVLRELAELGLQAEDWGGDTITAKVSAKSRAGLDELLELVALQAEILELQANPNKPARGRIVEAKLDKGRGPVATVLIQEGTLHQGDTFVCGVFSGRVRALFNDQGKKVKEAGPAIPVEVQGFDGVPEAGEEFVCVADEKLARRIADTRSIKQRERHLAKESKVTLETFLARNVSDKEALTLNLVLKADVQGSLEAITEALNKKSTDKVRINVVHGGAGAISESDILLASASQAIIIGFNVRPTAKIKDIAEQENVDIRFYDIIYKLGDDITSAMQGMLAPVQREQYLGQADVRDTFSVPKIGVIAGCHVADGKVTRNAGVRLLRDGVVVYTGKISSLKRFKDDAREVLKGYECGIGLENYNDIKVGDVIEAFEMIEEAATL